MSKLFEAIKKARKQGDSAPAAVDLASEIDAALGDRSKRIQPAPSSPGTAAPPAQRSLSTSDDTDRNESETRRDRSFSRVPDRHATPEEHMVSLIDPHSFEAEQFRALRHIIEERQRSEGLRVIGVTSAAEGDGKSLVSVNLAGALAQCEGSRVLLVDADLRAPTINACLGLRGAPAGLADVVTSTTLGLDDVAIERSAYNLTVLAAGKPPASPYEVLKSDRFGSLLAEARSRFDFIVVDTPPVLNFPDTNIVEGLVDGVVLVVGAHKTPRKMVDEAVASIPESKLIGLVFNGEDDPKRYRASTYYGKAGTGSPARRTFWGKRRR